MATKNPRTTVTLSPDTHAVLKELARLNDESMSATIGGLLEQVTPILQRMTTVLRAAMAARESVRERLAEDLEKAQKRMEKTFGLAMEDLEALEQPFLDLFDDVKRRSPKVANAIASPAEQGSARARASKRSAPAEGAPLAGRKRGARSAATPPSNRGVRSTRKNSSKPITTGLPRGVGYFHVDPAQPLPKRLQKRA